MCTIVSVVERQRNRSRRLGALTNGLFCREREHKAAIGLMSEKERAARRGWCLCQTEHLHCDRKCLKDSCRETTELDIRQKKHDECPETEKFKGLHSVNI